jgi:hypothetical protein
LGEYDTEGYITNVFVSGNHAYLAEKSITTSGDGTEVGGGFKILDISNPSAPVLVSTKTDGQLKYSLDVDTAYPYAYVSTTGGILYILDISSPKSPVVIGSYNAQVWGDIYYSDNYVYSALSGHVTIIDVNSPANPQLAGIYSNFNNASAVFVSSGYIYVTNRTTGILNVLQTISTSQTAQINLNRSNLYFGAVYNGIPTGYQTVLINNISEGQMEWTASTDQEWLKCAPDSGTNSGELLVSVETAGLSPGTYSGTLSVSSPQAANSPQTAAVTLKVYKQGNTSLPFGVFATPIEGSTVTSSIPVTGWVLDDIGIQHVKIYRQEGKSLVYIGDSVLVEGARPDVEQAYPHYPQSYRAGWGYMLLTNFLPNEGNGLFSLHTIAWSVKDNAGNIDGIGSRYFTIQNTWGGASGSAQSAGYIEAEGSFSRLPIDHPEPVNIKKGYNHCIEPQTCYPDENGIITIEIKELEPIDIHLPGATKELFSLLMNGLSHY